MKRLLLVLLVLVVAALAWLAAGRETSRGGTATPGSVADSHASAGELALLRERDDADPPPSRTAAPSLPVRAATDAETSGPTTTVEVLGVEDAPLPGARVKLTLEDEVHEGVTGADGRIAFPTSVAGRLPDIAVDAEGYLESRTLPNPQELLTIRLDPTALLTGRVLDAETGSPIAGARVDLYHECSEGCDRRKPSVTGGDGSYRFDRVHLGPVLALRVSAEGYPPFLEERQLAGPGPLVIDLRVDPGRLLRGTVEDLVTGAGLPGVVVRESDDATERVVTDASGAFEGRFVFADDDTAELWIGHPGYCGLRALLPRGDAPARIRLVPAVPVTGSVRDPEGRPIQDARVQVTRDWQRSAREEPGLRERTPLGELPSTWTLGEEETFVSGRTSAEGRFRTAGVLPWTTAYEVSVSAQGYGKVEEPLSAAGIPGQPLEQDFVLVPNEKGTLLGRATLNGVPLTGKVSWSCAGEFLETTLDPQGTFRLEDAPSGDGILSLQSPRLRSIDPGQSIHQERLALEFDERGAARHDVELELPLATVAGTVTWSDGSPARGTRLLLHGQDAAGGPQHLTWAEVAADGSFSVEVVVPTGPLLLEPAGAGYDAVPVRPGTEDLRLVLPRPGLLRFDVVDLATHASVQRFEIRATSATGGETWIGDAETPDQDGLRRAPLAPGSYDLHIESPDLGYLPADFEGLLVSSEGETRRMFELERGLTATFVRLEGTPLDEHTFFLFLEEDAVGTVRVTFGEAGSWNVDGGERFPGWTVYDRIVSFDDAGRASVLGLRPGRYGFQGVPPRLRVEPSVIELTPESTGPFQLRWRVE